MKPARLPENTTARRLLQDRLKGLSVKFPSGSASSATAAKVSGKWFEFGDNDRGIKALSFDFNGSSRVLNVRTSSGESRLLIGSGTWASGRGGFTNGVDRFLSVPANPLVAASGAWSTENTFTIKIVLPETPYYTTLDFKFEGDRVVVDAEHSVSFGPTKLPQLVGQAHITE